MNPATISRRLREDGFRISYTYAREGLRISRGMRGVSGPAGAPTVSAYFDDEALALRAAGMAGERLREMGYIVERNGVIIRVLGEKEV
jgi:hypothetical protein